MSDSEGLVADPLFVAMTRPPLRAGVTDLALIGNVLLTVELYLVVRNMLVLLIALPLHGLCALLCARDPRFFELGVLWCRTRLPSYWHTYRFWRASSYSALALDLPDLHGRRRLSPIVRAAHRAAKR